MRRNPGVLKSSLLFGFYEISVSAPATLDNAIPAFLADPLDRHHALVLGGGEHDHALGRAPGDADAVDRAADELAAVGDQHDLVGLLHREGRDHAAGLTGQRHGDDAFAAAAGGAVLVGRVALAEAALRQRQDELLGRRHLHIAPLAELDGVIDRRFLRLVGVGDDLFLAVGAAAHRIGAL